MNILFIINVKIFVLIKWSYRFTFTLMLTILFKRVFLGSNLGATPDHILHKYRYPNKKRNQIGVVYLKTSNKGNTYRFRMKSSSDRSII